MFGALAARSWRHHLKYPSLQRHLLEEALDEPLAEFARKVRAGEGALLECPERPAAVPEVAQAFAPGLMTTGDRPGESLCERVQGPVHLRNGKTVDPATNRFDTVQALTRIEMSSLDHELVSRHLSPGSSLTISDNGLSIETGAKGTDFIVLSKPESGLSELASNNTQ